MAALVREFGINDALRVAERLTRAGYPRGDGPGRKRSAEGAAATLAVRLPRADRDWLDAEAERRETTVTGVLRALIADARNAPTRG